MKHFTNLCIRIALPADLRAIELLLNNAYRGESSKQGWTTEASLIAGNTRVNERMLKQVTDMPNSAFLVYLNELSEITGCVNLQQHGNRIYLGMFSVSPAMQGAGIGKQLLKASEEYSASLHCQRIYMTVITARTELIDWYKRYGYCDTGERKPFYEDDVTGKHLQKLEFMVLEKRLY